MSNTQNWYIVKDKDKTCDIIALDNGKTPEQEHWGPFLSQDEAIARRVGLIRAGKCQPQ